MPDPYVYLGTNTLINKSSIRNQGQAQESEDIKSVLRVFQLKIKGINGKFDLSHLKKIHQHIFKDSYKWAGQIRTVNISKSSQQFAFPEYIESASKKIFNDIKNDDYLKGLNKEEFVGKVSYYFSEINALHPFREGNGRTQQTFISELAKEAGHIIDWGKTNKKEVNESSAASFNGNLELLQTVFNKLINK